MTLFFYETKLGRIAIAGNGSALTGLFFETTLNTTRFSAIAAGVEIAEDDLLREAHRQLASYLEKKLKCFDVPLEPEGTQFMKSVWSAVSAIPWGATASYGDIARLIGKPGASRAVGMANNRNPLPIFIPCHRVIGATGALVGYAGGIEMKARLLGLEDGSPVLF